MNTLHDQNLTPPEPVDAPEAPAGSPWVLTREAMLKGWQEYYAQNLPLTEPAPLYLMQAASAARFCDGDAVAVPALGAHTPGAVQAWYLPCTVTVVDWSGNVIECDRLEEWESGKLQARWAEDAAEDAALGDL